MPGGQQLRPDEALRLQQAEVRLQNGDAAGAVALASAVVAGGCRHFAAFLLQGVGFKRTNRLENALDAFKVALSLEPGRGDLWNFYGDTLAELGRLDEAMRALERAVALSPMLAEAWTNLGLAASSAGRHSRAVEALHKAARIAPNSAIVWGALGHAEQQSGALHSAAAHLRRALGLQPRLLSARHNLAVTLRMMDQLTEALVEVERGIAEGLTAPQTLALRAHLLADLGRFDDAVSQYHALLRTYPDYLDAQETLARLLPQLGRDNEALEGYRAALASMPQSEALWHSAMSAALELQRGEELKRWSVEAQRRFGEKPHFLTFRALAQGLLGEVSEAVEILERLATLGHPGAYGHAAYFRLRQGDYRAAEQHALSATAQQPLDQAAWAYLTVIWRLLGDEREAWLADYERLVIPLMIEPPTGSSRQQFLGELEEVLTRSHLTLKHPAEQSLREGTQTRGNLFERQEPTLRSLAEQIRRQMTAALAKLPADATHPFLSRNSGGGIKYKGAWSVRLRDGGFHVSHIHHSGWLSSAFYVALPAEMSTESEISPPPGALTFGVPDAALGLDLAPRRVEVPEAGKLVVFPSYFWHGTLPFNSVSPRLTVAFDALPG